MNTSLIDCATTIANAIPAIHTGDYPGLLCLFDGSIFVGITPIEDWEHPFEDALLGQAFDSAVVIAYESPPDNLEQQAQECTFHAQNGVSHGRPVRLLGIAEHTHPALTT